MNKEEFARTYSYSLSIAQNNVREREYRDKTFENKIIMIVKAVWLKTNELCVLPNNS